MSIRHVIAGAAALALAGSTAGAAFAGAAPAHRAKPSSVSVIAKHLVGPLSVAQAPDGTRYWTDDFAGTLFKQAPGGAATVAYQGTKKAPAEAVSADGGLLRFSTSSNNNKAGKIWTLNSSGAPVLIGDTYAYEKTANPDGKVKYGFLDTPKSCLNQVPKQVPASYKGSKESHPYSTATANGITYVGDAGANDVIAISPTGVVSTVALIKPAKVKVTKSLVKAFHLPSCTLGKKYALESVPTDIEVGPDGMLYVTSLPGGPESDALGLNGRVLRVNPATGKAKTVVRGLLSPTGVAVASNGDMYVAQLFKGEISKIKAGKSKVRSYLKVPFPAAVDVTPTGLLATTHAVPSGKKPKGMVISITF
jgi:glucose/arabinose dehydrogenase